MKRSEKRGRESLHVRESFKLAMNLFHEFRAVHSLGLDEAIGMQENGFPGSYRSLYHSVLDDRNS